MDTKIFRHNSGESYTVLSNSLLQDTNINFFTKGLLIYLLSLPKTWEISVAQIADKFGEKESRILKAFRELIDLGYCVRKAYHENGRLKGQHYYISDVAGSFASVLNSAKTEKAEDKEQSLFSDTAPIKNSVAENTDHCKNSVAENTDHCKNGGSYNKVNNNKEKINNQYNKNKKTLFSENPVLSNVDEVLSRFSSVEYESIDVLYYYHAVKDWSESSNTKRTENGWISTIRNFMRSDRDANKLHLKNQTTMQPGGKVNIEEAMQYLNM